MGQPLNADEALTARGVGKWVHCTRWTAAATILHWNCAYFASGLIYWPWLGASHCMLPHIATGFLDEDPGCGLFLVGCSSVSPAE